MSKFQFAGSVLLLTLAACSQPSPDAALQAAAAPTAAGSGSGTVAKTADDIAELVCGDPKAQLRQHGDGVYAVRYLSGSSKPQQLVGFSWIRNLPVKECPYALASAQAGTTEVKAGNQLCEITNWMVHREKSGTDGKFPLPKEQGVAYCFLGTADSPDKFETIALARALAELKDNDPKNFTYGTTVTLAACDGSNEIGCGEAKAPPAGSGSGSPK